MPSSACHSAAFTQYTTVPLAVLNRLPADSCVALGLLPWRVENGVTRSVAPTFILIFLLQRIRTENVLILCNNGANGLGSPLETHHPGGVPHATVRDSLVTFVCSWSFLQKFFFSPCWNVIVSLQLLDPGVQSRNAGL